MKKKILLLATMLMLIAGVVSASSLNGDYKGNPIVKVMSNGKQLESDEVPAMIYDGHTVVPISLLRQIGASVTWDANTYSVDVKFPQSTTSPNPTTTTTPNQPLLIKLAKVANMYKLTQDLSDRLTSHSNFLSLYFDGHNSYRTNAFTNKDATDRMGQLIEHYNLVSDKYNVFKNEITDINLTDLFNIIKMNYDAIEYYKLATSNIIDWNYYRGIYDNNKSQDSFNSYLSNSNSGFTLSNQASVASSKGYDTYILRVINQ
jgi:hypothetical protein